MLDEDLAPTKVAGVPPDYFSQDGQLWGNPIYNYERHAADGFKWWKSRLNRALSQYDYVRIDHFRGLDRFWSVPAGDDNARGGEWVKAPGREIFAGEDTTRIIAEDLGLIDDGVRELIAGLGVANMKVLSFAFDGDPNNPYLPWNVKDNSAFYTGTHDNNTVVGLYESSDEYGRARLIKGANECLSYLEIYKKVTGKYSLAEAFSDIVYASRADLAIVPMHDVLSLGSGYRINAPGTMDNWRVRYRLRQLTDTAAGLMRRRAKRFER